MTAREETGTAGKAEITDDFRSTGLGAHEEPLIVPKEAAQHLRISVATLLRHSRDAEIPGVRIGKLWRYRKSALDE